MAERDVRVDSVHAMNAERVQVAGYPQIKPTNLGCKHACRLLPSTPTVSINYNYSARRMVLILPHRGL